MAMTFQMLMRGLDGRTSCLRFPSSTIAGSLLQEHIATILRIPAEALLIVTGTRVINPHTCLCARSDGFFPSCSLLLRLRGGKGGFGSLLRGAATKAGQKKTSNFDACRDMSGRRLRHVNAEKKLKEWKAQAKERELEKAANEFLKKQVKQKQDESGCFQVIESFREETSRAREDVESAVARGLAEAKKLGKRKVVDDTLPSTSSKRTHIWFSSEYDAIGEDSEDKDEREGSKDEEADAEEDSEEGNEDEDAEEGSEDADMEKGFEDENYKEGSEDDKAKQGSEVVKGSEDADMEKGSEDENDKEGSEDDKAKQISEVVKVEGRFVDEKAKVRSEDAKDEKRSECEKDEERAEEKYGCNGLDNGHVEKIMPMVDAVEGDGFYTLPINVSVDVDLLKHQSHSCEEKIELDTHALPTCGENTRNKNGFHREPIKTFSVSVEMKDLPVQSKLKLDDYLHASELEVLGLERLKQELQVRGLKCGGSLAERAGRLFLLKTVPLEKMEKKHFAKARAQS